MVNTKEHNSVVLSWPGFYRQGLYDSLILLSHSILLRSAIVTSVLLWLNRSHSSILKDFTDVLVSSTSFKCWVQLGKSRRKFDLRHSRILERRNSELLDHTPKPIPSVKTTPSWKRGQLPRMCIEVPGSQTEAVNLSQRGHWHWSMSTSSTQKTSGPMPAQKVNTKYPEDQWTHAYTDSQHQVPRRPMDPCLHRQSTPSTQKTNGPMPAHKEDQWIHARTDSQHQVPRRPMDPCLHRRFCSRSQPPEMERHTSPWPQGNI